MNPSSTLQYLKKPFFWKLGYLKLTKKSKQTSGAGGDETEVNVATCVPLHDDVADGPLSLTAFRGELDSAVSQYISQVKDLGYKEEGPKDQKLLAVKFQLDPNDIKPRSKEEAVEAEPKVKVISTEDKGEQTELEVELPSLDNPLYLTLSECTSGLFPYAEEDLALEHLYENGHIGREDEHIYENVENATGEQEKEEHLYDTLPRHRPDLPPKPDFLSQLAARQSEPVKRAWNPFVSLSVDTGNPTPPLSTISSLSSPGSNTSNEHSEEALQKSAEKSISNPFLSSRPTEPSEHTLILDGSETSDLGSSGGEYDVGSVEDWPLPPTPPLGEEEVLLEDNPLPPPPPELALQQLEEEVFREEEEERKIVLQKEQEVIEQEYGVKTQDIDATEQVEAVNTNLTSLEEKLKETSESGKATKEPEPEKKPKIIEIDEDDIQDFDTPAIRHSVIIALKDSCPSVPKSIKPSDIRRKENLKRSESLKHSGVVRRSSSHKRVNRRESICSLFPSIIDEFKKSEGSESVSLDVTSSKKEEPSFSFLDTVSSRTNQVIEISDDGSWEMKHPSKDSKNNNQNNKADIDPFTGDPIMTPPLSPATITAPPTEFQTNDGVDGVYSANVISTYSGPSSLTSTAADSIGTGDFVGPETSTSTLLAASETILEEPSYSQDSELVECYNEASDGASASTIAGRQVMSPSHKNLGAAIMESYEMEFKKKKESMNLPEHSLLEFGDTVRALEEQRRSVIKQMTVKAKRKDTWIKTFSMHDQGKEDNIPVAPSRIKRKPSPTRPETVAKPVAFIQDTTDSSFSGLPKSEMGFFKSQKSTLENITLLNSPLTSARASAAVEPVADPPKVSRKKKPVEPEHAPAATTKSENCHSITVDCDISLKNTEAQLQYLPPPIEVTKDIMEHDMSSQDTTKVDGDNPEEVAVFPEVPEVLAEVPVGVDELVSPAQVAFPPVNTKPEAFPVVPAEPLVVDNCPQSPAASKESPVKEIHDLPPPPPPEPIEPVEHSRTETEEDAMVREKNEINLVHSAMAKYLSHEVTEGKEKTVEVENEEAERIEVASPELVAEGPVSMASDAADLQEDEGEVEYFSILDNKSATKNYWETRMLATMDDGGWESVANVRFQPLPGVTPVVLQTEGSPSTVTPPPEFIPAPPPQFDNSPMESEGSSPPSLEAPAKQSPAKAQAPTKQYVYGINDAAPKEMRSARIVETVAKKPPTQENVIEAEIRAQQMKEAELRQNGTLKSTTVVREKGASSPASHDSDEGFVDRVVEDVPAAPTSGYTHAIPGNDGEPVIYDAVSPPPVDFPEARTPTPSANSTETKIALEIRELKEREEELRQMRERLMTSRENLLDDEEVRSSASREQLLEDHLTSLTTTTDEGNFSECGDPASSEDKSSDGSNSRIMSPDLQHPGTALDFGRRKVTVKPFEDEEEDQPVYTRMQKESVIEREIRLAREREEAHRREKGITYSTTNGTIPSSRSTNQSTTKAPVVTNNDGRDVQHRMATSRIQMEIQETSMKERELRDAGKILTMSEERVDAKVTRMSDFNDQNLNESPRTRPTPPRPSNFSTPSSTPKRSPSPLSPSSPVPNFTPSPGLSRGLSRSLSTNNLASSTSLANPRSAPKGLMQKFIASRGKMTGSAFASPPLTLTQTISTSRGIPTRPMRVEPKAAVVQRETLARMKPQHVETGINQEQTSQSQKQHNHIQQQYRRSYCTAEEKIQSELKEMQMREEELRRLRAHQMAQSQPNLLDLGTEEEDQETVEETCEGFQEVNGLRTTLSNPNLLDDESDQTQALDKGVRRRSALIAQWENRIQQTTDT